MPRESIRMKRDISTSTIGREERKPQMEAYMFERRILFGCSVLYGLSLIAWIIAIATDHWIVISGLGGIFIPETRRFFMSSHSGLWRHCRYTSIPYALPEAKVARNFTSIAFQTSSNIIDAKLNISREPYIDEFLNINVTFPITDFSDETKQRMFAHWVKNEDTFIEFKQAFLSYISSIEELNVPIKSDPPIIVRPLEINTKSQFGDALMEVKINNTDYFIIAPAAARLAIFNGWNEKQYVPKLFWPYIRDLGLPAYVTNKNGNILQLVPPKPANKKNSKEYEYIPNKKCKYIKMFSSAETEKDPAFDEELLDYIRTQASFACINVFVMTLGLIFAFYTFLNPRYMFKRLAGGVLLVSAFTSLVVIQVLLASVDYTKEHIIFAYPEGAEFRYGYGVILAWFSFSTNVICGIMFLWYSKKKKGSKAPTDEFAMADEPINMGR